MIKRVLYLYVITLIVSSGLAASDRSYEMWGLPIEYIRFESEIEVPNRILLNALAVSTGEVLTPEGVDQCLRNFNLLNRFSSVQAFAQPMGDGCALVFKFDLDWQVNRITFEGGAISGLFSYGLSGGFSPKTLAREIGIKVGDVYHEKHGTAAVEALLDFYFRRGYANARIELKPDYLDSRAAVNLRFEIDQGKPTKISEINFIGNNSFNVRQLLIASDLFTGKQFKQTAITEARKRLLKYYRKRNYLGVKIYRPEVRYLPETNSVTVDIEINEGKPVFVEIETRWHTWNIMWWLYFLENRPDLFLQVLGIEGSGQIDSQRMHGGGDVLRDEFKNHGYLNAGVTVSESVNPDGELTYKFHVDEQERVKVKELFIFGTTSFSPEEIQQENILGTNPGNYYHMETLNADEADLARFYRQNGFQDVSVSSGVSTAEHPKFATVVFNIEEGMMYRWGSIEINGNSEFSDEEILSFLQLHPGSPFDLQTLDTKVSLLLDEYLSRGYPEISIEREVTKTDPYQPDLVLEIIEGSRATIGSVIITGLSKTRPYIIERNLPKLSGEPFFYQKLMAAERQLAKTNLFRAVDVAGVPGEAGASERTVVVRLREQPFVFLEGGPGYNTDRGFNGYLSFFTTNLGGANRYLGASGSISEEDSKANVIYREPEFANLPVQLELRLLTENSREDGFRLRRRGGRATWSYWLMDKMRVLAVYRFDDDDPYDIDGDTDLPEEYQDPVKIASLSPGILYDSRDDPRDPTHGSLLSFKIEFARTVYSSEVNFTKATAEITHFFDLPGDGVFGSALRLGLGYHLPYQEQFRLGGIKTIRGWGYEKIRGKSTEALDSVIGTTDEDGDIMILLNLEYRHPLIWGFEGVFFLDSGNVFDSGSEIEFDNFRSTLGLGVRLMTPVGPVGVDYGYNIMREDSDPRDKWSFVIGHTF